MKIKLTPIITIIFFCTLFSFIGRTQLPDKLQKQADSLTALIDSPKSHDTTLADAYVKLSEILYISNLDTVIYLCEKSKSIAEKGLAHTSSKEIKFSFKMSLANALNNIGYIYDSKGDTDKALTNYLEAIKIREEIDDKEGIAASIHNIAYIYINQGDILKALEHYQKGLKLFEEIGNKRGLAYSLNSIGFIYHKQEDTVKALEFYHRALKIREEIDDKGGISYSLNNIAGVYLNLQDYDKALEYHLRALAIREELGHKEGIASSLNNIGSVYNNKGDYQKALEYYERSLDISEKQGDKKGISSAMANIGSAYIKLNRVNEAEKYAQESMRLARELNYAENIKVSAQLLSDIYARQGRGMEAYEAFRLYTKMRDSIKNEETQRATIEREFRYKYIKKSAEDSVINAKKIEVKDAKLAQHEAEIKTKKSQQYFLIGGLLLVLASAILLFKRLRITRKQNRIISLQKEQIEKERNKSDQLLLNILPKETAFELKKKGKTNAKKYESATVLFTDFVDFTQISEQLNPAELIIELDEMFKEFDKITEQHNMEKIKTIGDSYMCAGGIPIENKTNAIDAVLTGLAFQRSIEERSKNRSHRGWHIRLGIHTGEIIAGVIGAKRFAYDIWGDTVNVASRMESSGEPGKVNISDTTYQLISPFFECDYRGEIDAKNKGQIKMYFVQSIKPELSENGEGLVPNMEFYKLYNKMQ